RGVDPADVGVADVAYPRRFVGELYERLPVVGAPEQLAHLFGRDHALRRHVAARQQALVEGHEVRCEGHGEAVAQLPLELRAVAVPLNAVRVHVLVDRYEVGRPGRLPAGPRDARLRVDDGIARELAQRRQGEQRGGWVAA